MTNTLFQRQVALGCVSTLTASTPASDGICRLTGKHAVGNPMINAGLTALTSITLTNLVGTRITRNVAYEVFLVGHIINNRFVPKTL